MLLTRALALCRRALRFVSTLPTASGKAKHSNRSCYANLQLSRTIKTIVNLHSMTCCYTWRRHCLQHTTYCTI